MITCKFCDAQAGTPAEPEFFGDIDVDACDVCGRYVCMDCASFDFTGAGMRYLCPDCGQPVHVVMERIGAPALPFADGV